MAKKITNRSILGQRGINLIEEFVLAMGFSWHPTNQSIEAGIDGHIELRNPESEQALIGGDRLSEPLRYATAKISM